ncbi:nucleoside diphosphate kinase 6 [Ischnura elegans]|uniref:nucleoside diphosphate kinase 6 n=1 Tax=Ischnura elegans TaxID=197161 RepID=UPI001ED8AE0C|nr:nucleoside diphosphate kinase 6 [Ischnura elegans]XP_046405384.1 nucleoside diphosphate kinase 6 [Ischnura elegans]
MKCLDLTLAIIKPNATKVPHVVKAIRDRILRCGFFVVRTSEVQLSIKEAEEFYKEHKGKFFYERLSSFLASGPVHVHILAGVNSIILWRRILGPARVYQAKAEYPNSIRALYGVTDTRNSAHGSDSEQSALREIHFFFPNFDIDNWRSNEECYFQSCQVKLKEKEFIHEICPSIRA